MSRITAAVSRMENVQAYLVNNGTGEWGVFYVEHGRHDAGPNWVRLTAQTSFGNAGHTWGNIGPNAWQDFFARTSKNSLCTKMLGEAAVEFDPTETMKSLTQSLTRELATTSSACDEEGILTLKVLINCAEKLTSEAEGNDLNQLADLLGEDSCDNDEIQWYETFERSALEMLCENKQERFSASSNGFYDELWPHFIEAVQSERELNNPEGVAPARPRDRQ